MTQEQELMALAREIAASEGETLAQALERAALELRSLKAYAHAWDRMTAEAQSSPLYVVQAA
jgi:hypothetical protein